MDHTPFTLKYSRSSTVTISDQTRVQGVTGNHDEDHSVSMSPVPTSSSVGDGDNNQAPISVTALVIGLAAAAFFLLMVVYVIYKVHWKGGKKMKKKSSINHKTLESVEHNEPTTFHAAASLPSVASNLSNLWRSSLPNKIGGTRASPIVPHGIHTIDFKNMSSSGPVIDTASNARLTAARFFPSGQ